MEGQKNKLTGGSRCALTTETQSERTNKVEDLADEREEEEKEGRKSSTTEKIKTRAKRTLAF